MNLINNEYVRKNDSTLITFGINAYNIYLKSIKDEINIGSKYYADVPYLEFISTNYKFDAVRLINFIKQHTNENRVTYVEYHPFFDFYGYRIEIRVDNKPLVYIYHNNDNCIPYITTSKNGKIVTFTYLLMMFMMLKFRFFIEKKIAGSDDITVADEKNSYYNCYGQLISNMIHIRNLYFKITGKGPLDNTVFKEFIVQCVGETLTQDRKYKIDVMTKKESGKVPIFRYNPEKKSDLPKYNFPNTSGNVIKSLLMMKIKTLDESQLSNSENDNDSEYDENEITSLTK